jgi:hypothetical protein
MHDDHSSRRVSKQYGRKRLSRDMKVDGDVEGKSDPHLFTPMQV